jgi:hypothetical protein
MKEHCILSSEILNALPTKIIRGKRYRETSLRIGEKNHVSFPKRRILRNKAIPIPSKNKNPVIKKPIILGSMG